MSPSDPLLGWAQELVELVEGPCAYVSREGAVLAGNEAFVQWAPRCLAGSLVIRPDGAWIAWRDQPPVAVRVEPVTRGGWLVLPAGDPGRAGLEAVATSVGRRLERLSTSIESNLEMALRARPGEAVTSALREALSAVEGLRSLRRHVDGLSPLTPTVTLQTLDLAALAREAVMALSGPPPVEFTGEASGCVVQAGREPLFAAVAAITGAMCRNLPRGGRVVVASTRDADVVRLSFRPEPDQAGFAASLETEAARAAVEQARGRLLVLADTVILELPAFEGSRPQAEGARGTVLVADDDPSMLSLMAAVLRRKGFTVIEAGNGVAATTFLRTHGAELAAVVTDAVLPGRSGVELAVEAAASFPGLPVLVVTSHDAKLVGVKELPLLRKPFGAKLFADRVEQILRREP